MLKQFYFYLSIFGQSSCEIEMELKNRINNTDYLMFDECDEIFVNGYDETIKFKDLENHIKNHF